MTTDSLQVRRLSSPSGAGEKVLSIPRRGITAIRGGIRSGKTDLVMNCLVRSSYKALNFASPLFSSWPPSEWSVVGGLPLTIPVLLWNDERANLTVGEYLELDSLLQTLQGEARIAACPRCDAPARYLSDIQKVTHETLVFGIGVPLSIVHPGEITEATFFDALQTSSIYGFRRLLLERELVSFEALLENRESARTRQAVAQFVSAPHTVLAVERTVSSRLFDEGFHASDLTLSTNFPVIVARGFRIEDVESTPEARHIEQSSEASLLSESFFCVSCGFVQSEAEDSSFELGNVPIHSLPATLSIPPTGKGRDRYSRLEQIVSWLSASGLGHLKPSQSIDDLSSGEKVRIQLCGILAAEVSEVMFVLDEPARLFSVSDRALLTPLLQAISKGENSVLLCERPEDAFLQPDCIIELEDETETSATERILITPRESQRVELSSAQVVINREGFTPLTGASGSGKTRLLRELVAVLGSQKKAAPKRNSGAFRAAVYAPLQEFPQSQNPTLLELIQGEKLLAELFVTLPKARQQGLDVSAVMSGSHPDVKLGDATLQQVKEIPLERVRELVKRSSLLSDRIELLCEVGFGASVLSQRVSNFPFNGRQKLRLVRELCAERPRPTLIAIEEPFSGMRGEEIQRVINAFGERLVAAETTVVFSTHDEVFVEG